MIKQHRRACLVTENSRVRSDLRHHLYPGGPGKIKLGTCYLRSDVSTTHESGTSCYIKPVPLAKVNGLAHRCCRPRPWSLQSPSPPPLPSPLARALRRALERSVCVPLCL